MRALFQFGQMLLGVAGVVASMLLIAYALNAVCRGAAWMIRRCRHPRYCNYCGEKLARFTRRNHCRVCLWMAKHTWLQLNAYVDKLQPGVDEARAEIRRRERC